MEIKSSSRSSSSGYESSNIFETEKPAKIEISLQCSILSPEGHQEEGSSQEYEIYCDYESGSKHGNMGSVDSSKEWDGV